MPFSTGNAKRLDDLFVYPGHSVQIACQIMIRYKDYDAASQKGDKYPAALEDDDIHGSGGSVYGGLDLLRLINEGMSGQDAFAFAQDRWRDARGNGRPDGDFAKNLDEGVAKAEELLPDFLRLVETWGQANRVTANEAALLTEINDGSTVWRRGCSGLVRKGFIYRTTCANGDFVSFTNSGRSLMDQFEAGNYSRIMKKKS